MNDNPKKWLLILGVITLFGGVYNFYIAKYFMGVCAILIAGNLILGNYKAFSK